MKVHKVTLLVVDHDDIGADEMKVVIENTRYPNRCISPDVMAVETCEVEWTDSHPLNHYTRRVKAFEQLFGKEGT